jgi:hypothetical protein
MRARNEQGEIVFNSDDPQTKEAVLEEFFDTPIGQRFNDGFNTEINRGLIREAITRLYGEDFELTASLLIDVVRTLFNAGEFTKEEAAPTDRNGRPLSSSQLAWQEHAQWAANHSQTEAQTRATTDASFGKWLKARPNVQPTQPKPRIDNIPGAVLLNPEPVVSPTAKITPELRAFAEEYERTPIYEAKLKTQQNPVYRQNFEAAISAGLI